MVRVSILAVRGPLEVLRAPQASWRSSADKHSVMWFDAPNRISLEVWFTSVGLLASLGNFGLRQRSGEKWAKSSVGMGVYRSSPRILSPPTSRSGTWLHSAVSEWGTVAVHSCSPIMPVSLPAYQILPMVQLEYTDMLCIVCPLPSRIFSHTFSIHTVTDVALAAFWVFPYKQVFFLFLRQWEWWRLCVVALRGNLCCFLYKL